MTIAVVKAEKKGYKIMVNWIQRGVVYSTAGIANQEATKVKEHDYPQARLVLAPS